MDFPRNQSRDDYRRKNEDLKIEDCQDWSEDVNVVIVEERHLFSFELTFRPWLQ